MVQEWLQEYYEDQSVDELKESLETEEKHLEKSLAEVQLKLAESKLLTLVMAEKTAELNDLNDEVTYIKTLIETKENA